MCITIKTKLKPEVMKQFKQTNNNTAAQRLSERSYVCHMKSDQTLGCVLTRTHTTVEQDGCITRLCLLRERYSAGCNSANAPLDTSKN